MKRSLKALPIRAATGHALIRGVLVPGGVQASSVRETPVEPVEIKSPAWDVASTSSATGDARPSDAGMIATTPRREGAVLR